MARLVVRLLGGFRVELDGEPVYGFETDKARALLVYLMVEADRPHRRESLASLLWPERPNASARSSLRHALFRVRQALVVRDPSGRTTPAPNRTGRVPNPFLFVTPMDVQFNPASDCSLDVAELQSLAARPDAEGQLLPEAFCGEFLAGFSIPDSEPFEAWMLSKQEYYHRLALDILSVQNADFEILGQYERAVTAARLQLKLESWLEEAHRRCMRGLAMAGRRDAALRQYEVCCRALKSELGVEPASCTQALYNEIRDGRLVAPTRTEPDRSLLRQVAMPAGFDIAPAPPPTLLIARENELGQLGNHLEAALAGKIGVAFVSGDPGSGKTALLEAFAASAMAKYPELLVAGARCNPGGQADPLAPLRRLTGMLAGGGSGEVGWRLVGTDQTVRLRDAAGLVAASLRECGPDLTGTLLPPASSATRFGKEPAVSQGALFDQLTNSLAAIARQRPLLLLLDDLQWVDEATVACLLQLNRELSNSRSAACRILVLGAYRSTAVGLGRCDPRSGEVIRHPMLEVLNELRRARGEITVDLDKADGRAFVEALVDMEPNRLGARFRDALFSQTGGHALFTVEIVHNLQVRRELVQDEAGRWEAAESINWGKLPVRVEAAIAERIERLPDAEHHILSAASVQGDDFSGELAAELAGQPLNDVMAALSGPLARQHALVRAEGLQRLGGALWSVYRFTHHLFQKYLYDQLDPIERARLHGAVGAALHRQVANDPAERERLGAQLAWHYEAAGQPLEAARALHDAGRQAMKVSALREALDRFDHALALLAGEPPSAERAEIERLLQTDQLSPQASVGGVGSSRLEKALALAGDAGAHAVHGRSRLLMLQAKADLLNARGQCEDGLAVADQMLEEATQCGDASFVANAHFWSGLFLHIMGKPQEAEERFELAIARLSPELDDDLRAAGGFELAPMVLSFSALNWWFLGYPERAQDRAARALSGAVARGDRFGQAFASALGSMTLFLLRSDAETLRARAEPGHLLCQHEGIGWWQDYLEILLGRLAMISGRLDAAAGIERMRSAIAGWQGKGMVVGTDGLLVVLAEGCLAAARRESPLGELNVAGDGALPDRSAAIVLEAIEPFLGPTVPCGQSFQAELLRMRGELLLARDGLAAADEALACFDHGLRLAREKGALAWELRAVMSIVRLRTRQGEAYVGELAEARTRLAEVYGRFAEGFAFPDLQDAAALLEVGERMS